MFLDAFMNTSESSIPDFDDLQLEYAVSLEAAYNDFMLEGCRLEFQAISENSSVEVLNEGIFDLIKKFFKTIWNFLKKIFGVKGSGGSSGGGGSSGSSGGGSSSGVSTNTKDQKKEAEELNKELERQKKEFEKLMEEEKKKFEERKEAEELKKNADEAQKKLEEEERKRLERLDKEQQEKIATLQRIQQTRLEVEAKIKAEIQDEIDQIQYTKINDPFVSICPISSSFINYLIANMNELCEEIQDMHIVDDDIDHTKLFEGMQKNIEFKFLTRICDAIDQITNDMRENVYRGNGNGTFLMDVDDVTVAKVIARYKELTASRQSPLKYIITVHHEYDDFKKVIQAIKSSAIEELTIDFQAQLDNLAKATMKDIKSDNTYSNANKGSLIARIKMRLIADLSQIIGAIGIENKKARFYQLTGIRSLLRAAKRLDAVRAKKVDINYIYSEMRKRGVEP